MIRSEINKIIGILIIFVITFSFGCSIIQEKTDTEIEASDFLINHPIYKDYEFSQDEKVIDFGYQPLYVPTSNIFEIMERDSMLKEELNSLGYSIKFYKFLKGNDINYFLKSKDLEIGIGGDMPVLRSISDGDSVAISIIQEGPISIVSRDILEVNHLKGKRIGYASGSNGHFYLLNTLIKNGVDISKVKLVKMEVSVMPEALNNNEIDAFAAWEPTPTMAIAKYPGFRVMHSGNSYGFIYVRKEFIEKNEMIVHHILASEIRALRWLKLNNENLDISSQFVINDIIELAPDIELLTKEQLSALAKKDLPGRLTKQYPRIPSAILSDGGIIQREFELLKELGLISKEVIWREVVEGFDLEIMETVISDFKEHKFLEQLGSGDLVHDD